MRYRESADIQEQVKEARDAIDRIIEEKRDMLGIGHIRPLNLSKENAETLRQAIKKDQRWQEQVLAITKTLAPKTAHTPREELLTAIQIPWWNGAVLHLVGDSYDDGTLNIDSGITHSYISQFMRTQKTATTNQDSMSVSNILLTKDDVVVLGMRGGHTYSDTIMCVPAGSAEYHSGKNPLFETLYAEHEEEVGLTQDDFDSTTLLGKIADKTLGRNSLYVFRTRTNLTYQEVVERYNSALDNREHKSLIPLEDDAEKTIDFIVKHRYDPAKANPTTPAITTEENKGSVLPPCVGSLLVHYAERHGKAWAAQAEQRLEGAYPFIKR
jgi:hypothetical protein